MTPADVTFEAVGTGLTVYEDDPVEGPAVWLDSPQAVIGFVSEGPVADSIAIVRGGTTTFLTPVLMAGVKGIVTLQGAPESHLGILAREYGVPCLMSVEFAKGMRTPRGEVVPADGTLVRLDVTTSPRGTVLVDTRARTSDGPSVPATPEMDPDTMAQIQVLLEKYRGQTPHGDEGNRMLQSRLGTRTLHLDDDTLDRELRRDEANEMLDYVGWAMWDCLAARATEGESGLIPRQEYEALGFLQTWQRYPQLQRFITDEIGADGLFELGAVARYEIGTKINILRNLALGFMVAFGRGVSIALGYQEAGERDEDLRTALQFMRRLYKGTWGDNGTMFTCSRGYAAPLLGAEWIERFRADAEPLTDPEQRRAFQRFSASAELMGFLVHFDYRGGVADTGPYPLDDGSFLIVRDHFLNEDIYHWADVAQDLPHAVTQAMIFKPDAGLEVSLVDIGTIFTKPANYLRYITGAAFYARDRWDTPISDIRPLDADGRARILAGCEKASAKLYRRIAAMSRRDRIMAGVQVYYADFIVPYARRAGLWDRMRDDLDFFEIDPVTAEAYYPLVGEGQAATLVPQLFITGSGFPPIPAE
ncbi:MAG: PEP-utilizing enzyme [Acidimicrobiia bacterium]